jgi:hypothetical protein
MVTPDPLLTAATGGFAASSSGLADPKETIANDASGRPPVELGRKLHPRQKCLELRLIANRIE